jgi:hypothetical protein
MGPAHRERVLMSRVPGTFKSRPGVPREVGFPPGWAALYGHGARRFALDDCTVLVAREPLGPDGALRWHLSISHPSRYPTWDEIKTARYELLAPELTMAMLLPPPSEYVNVEAQDNVFHLHEIEGEPSSSGR